MEKKTMNNKLNTATNTTNNTATMQNQKLKRPDAEHERQGYAELFKEIINYKLNYIRQPDELFTQSDDCPYHFISSSGRRISIYNPNKPVMLKPLLNKRTKDRSWKCSPNYSKKHFKMHQELSKYFNLPTVKSDESTKTVPHHMLGRSNKFNAYEENNVSVLENVDAPTHKILNRLSTIKDKDKSIEKVFNIKKPKKYKRILVDEDTIKWLLEPIFNNTLPCRIYGEEIDIDTGKQTKTFVTDAIIKDGVIYDLNQNIDIRKPDREYF